MDTTLIFWIVASTLSVVAIAISIWQGITSAKQLKLAQDVNNKTENLLENIKEKIIKIETISDETRKDVKEQVRDMIKQNDENFKHLLKSSKEIDQNQLMTAILPSLFQNPDWFENIMKLAEMWKK